jgi:hypothetical protein
LKKIKRGRRAPFGAVEKAEEQLELQAWDDEQESLLIYSTAMSIKLSVL